MWFHLLQTLCDLWRISGGDLQIDLLISESQYFQWARYYTLITNFIALKANLVPRWTCRFSVRHLKFTIVCSANRALPWVMTTLAAIWNRRITKKRHIDCAFYRLNLKIKTMIEVHAYLSSAIMIISKTMRYVKSRLKSAATLRNLMYLRALVDNDTRWSWNVPILRRFEETRE